MSARVPALLAGAIALFASKSVRAEPTQDDLGARRAFIEERLATQRAHADAWWWGWSIFYGIGIVVQGVRATDTDNDADKADRIIGAVQSSGALIRLLAQPNAGIEGPPQWGARSRTDLEAYVAEGERRLDSNAEATNAFGPWYAHLINLGINGAAGLFIGLRYGAWDKAALSTGIGIAIGEVNILSAPWEADADRAEYRARFGGAGVSQARPRWSIAPAPGGIAIATRF